MLRPACMIAPEKINRRPSLRKGSFGSKAAPWSRPGGLGSPSIMKRITVAHACKPILNALVAIILGTAICACPFLARSQSAPVHYEEPAHLIGNIYAKGAESGKVLFKSERRATRTGDKVRVTCDYSYPDGAPAAHHQIIYESGRLSSFEEQLLQTGEKGSAVIRSDPRDPARERIFFEYSAGLGSEAKKSSASEVLEKDTLVDDMIPAFITAHWEALQKGEFAKFRYIVLSRKETVGFKLVKESETTWKGTPVVRIKMEPASFVIAQLVEPLYFIVEKQGQHRILEYVGRTTPLVKSGNKWKELDAVSIFEWNQNNTLHPGER